MISYLTKYFFNAHKNVCMGSGSGQICSLPDPYL